jgi:regulatory protein
VRRVPRDPSAPPAQGRAAQLDGPARLRQDALRFLRVRERTVREVGDYLKRRGHAAALIAEALRELCESGFVSDRRFAEMFLRDRQRLRPMSRVAAARDLAARGVPPAIVAEALAEADPPWDDQALAHALLARKWPRWGVEQRELRGRRLLRARGFGPGTIRAVITQLQQASGGEISGDAWIDEADGEA